jgi:NTE family protein
MAASETADRTKPALALSGGGFRATLYHLGALKRLNELKYLSRFERISSVSGGSIAAGMLRCVAPVEAG